MRYGPGSFTPGELERLQRERLERERIEQLMHLGNALLGGARQRPTGLADPRSLAPPAASANAGYPQHGGVEYQGQPMGGVSAFPFRQDNRNPDGTWTAPDANRANVRGTSVDPEGPVWPRWKQTPPPHGEGEFVSEEPFFDIDEITQKAEFYPPGRPLVDFNVDGNPASRQRGSDLDAGNSWRRRLLLGRSGEGHAGMPSRENLNGPEVDDFADSLGLSGSSRSHLGRFNPSEIGQASLRREDGESAGTLQPRSYALANAAPPPDQARPPGPETPQSGAMQSIKPVDIVGKTSGRVIGRRYELGAPSEKGGVLIQEVHDVSGKMYLRGKGERNVRDRQAPYTEILGEIRPMEKATGKKDDDHMRRPGETVTIWGDVNGRGTVYFLEGKTVEQLKREGFNNPSSRTKLNTGDKLSKPGRYGVPAGTPNVPVDFNIKW